MYFLHLRPFQMEIAQYCHNRVPSLWHLCLDTVSNTIMALHQCVVSLVLQYISYFVISNVLKGECSNFKPGTYFYNLDA